jgi:septum formation protein
MSYSLILASTSPARQGLLRAVGLRFEVMAPKVDESVPAGTSVADAVALLAERKARAIAKVRPEALVLAADQLVSLDGEALGKPPDREHARAQLRRLMGRDHEIVTGVHLLGPEVDVGHVETTRLRIRVLAPEELERYLDLEEWRGCAGGYRVEGAGQALFERIDGDRTNVQGLPMTAVVRLLRKAGVEFFHKSG